MKKLLLVTAMLLSIGYAKAQDVVDDFNVGPYEVYYKGQGDVNFRLKKGVDLYEYFGLKRDTVIYSSESTPEYKKSGIQITFNGEAGTNRDSRNSLNYRLEGVWKLKVAKSLYFNVGLSFGLSYAAIDGENKNILECGVPIYLETCKLSLNKSSLYFGFGVTPAFYSITDKSDIFELNSDEKPTYQGLYIAPGIDLGGYVPFFDKIVKIGVAYRYKVNCTTSTFDPYAHGVGQSFIGANIGIIF